jgi:prepilin-type N-terminal cleavage/methylation domain-containing protein
MKKLLKDQKGFTIIEVMIVLVIAAVIILIVFLAVPALQRNARNNQRKSDAARISAAVSEYTNNTNGSLPTTWGNIKPYLGNMAFYTTLPADAATITNATTNQTVTNADTAPAVALSGTCQTSGANIGTAATSSQARQFVVLYKVEGGTTDPPQCIAG